MVCQNKHTYIGKRCPTHDAEEKVLGKAVYTVDMRMPGMLFAKMLFSPVPHAVIKSIDASAAEAMPGVHYVATCMNTTDFIFNSARRFIGHNMKPDEQIFPRKVRYVGDRVAAVVADTEEIAQEALKRIRVEYEKLPAVYDVEEALKPEAPEIHEGGNQLGRLQVKAGDVDAALERADYVFTGRYRVPVVHHFAMEPHAAAANYDGRNLTVWTSAQNIFAYRVLLADILQLPVNRVRVIRATVGGGFGGKYEMVLESIAAWLAYRTKRPVLLELSRKDSMISTRTRHGAVVDIKAGFDKAGVLQAVDYVEYGNAGAYAGSTMNVLGGASAKSMMLYRMPNARFTGIGVYTNTPVAGAMRGYGSPQIETPLELLMDRAANEMGMDPVELRRKNLVWPGDLNPAKHCSLGNARVRDCLTKGCEMIGWTPEVTVSPDGRYRKAIGFSCGVHGNGVSGVMIDTTTIQLKMAEDGSVFLFTGTQDIGQGNIMVLKLILAETMQIDPEAIEVMEADTTTTPFDMGTFSSRCTWVAGETVRQAAEKMLALLRREAVELLNAEESDVVLDRGTMVDCNHPQNRVTFQECVLHAQQVSCRGELSVSHSFYSEHNPGSYAADFAEVEVDTLTGDVSVLRFVAVHDVGRAINPMALEGQIEGGIQMGLGYALSEELQIDERTGAVSNAHPKRYHMFRASEMPRIQIALIEEGEEYGPYGAKSIGEMATVAVGSAVINAVNRAMGIHLTQLPATPERIKAAAEKEKGGGHGTAI